MSILEIRCLSRVVISTQSTPQVTQNTRRNLQTSDFGNKRDTVDISSPPLEIVSKGVWPIGDTYINVKTHLKSTFIDAVALLNATSRTLFTDDEKYLHVLLTHDCG